MHPDTLEQLRDVFKQIPFNQHIGLKLDEIHDQYVTSHLDMTPELVGNYLYGILHGGVISSVLDMAGGVAVLVAIIKKHPDKTLAQMAEILGKSSTISLNVNFIRPGKGKTFTAKSHVTHNGNKVSFASMELFNESAKLIASATGVYSIG